MFFFRWSQKLFPSLLSSCVQTAEPGWTSAQCFPQWRPTKDNYTGQEFNCRVTWPTNVVPLIICSLCVFGGFYKFCLYLQMAHFNSNSTVALETGQLTKESACKHAAGGFRRRVRRGISVEVLRTWRWCIHLPREHTHKIRACSRHIEKNCWVDHVQNTDVYVSHRATNYDKRTHFEDKRSQART